MAGMCPRCHALVKYARRLPDLMTVIVDPLPVAGVVVPGVELVCELRKPARHIPATLYGWPVDEITAAQLRDRLGSGWKIYTRHTAVCPEQPAPQTTDDDQPDLFGPTEGDTP